MLLLVIDQALGIVIRLLTSSIPLLRRQLPAQEFGMTMPGSDGLELLAAKSMRLDRARMAHLADWLGDLDANLLTDDFMGGGVLEDVLLEFDLGWEYVPGWAGQHETADGGVEAQFFVSEQGALVPF